MKLKYVCILYSYAMGIVHILMHHIVVLEMKCYLGCIDQLISQALGDGLDVPESSFSCSCAQQPDGLKEEDNISE